MKKQIFEIDTNGFYLKDVIIELESDYPQFYTDKPLPKDIDGNQLPFYIPIWDGNAWLENMAQTEIDAIKNIPIPKTPTELLQEENEILKANQESINKTLMALMSAGIPPM